MSKGKNVEKKNMRSKYAKNMLVLSQRIFREVPKPDVRTKRVERIFSGIPAHLDPYYVKYYPRLIEMKQLMDGLRAHGLYRDEHEDLKDEMKKRREARGKIKKVPIHILRRREREANKEESDTP